MRAKEIGAEVILKATKVDGIYAGDPMIDKSAEAVFVDLLSAGLESGLKVMDSTAISLCMDNKMPIIVYNLREPGNLRRVVCGEAVGTTVTA